MSKMNASNSIGDATVRITADTAPLKEGVAEAKQEVASIGDASEASADKGASAFDNLGLKIGAIATAAITGFKAGNELLDLYLSLTGQMTSGDFQRALEESFDPTAAVQKTKERLKELQQEMSYFSAANYASALGFDGMFDAKMALFQNARDRLKALQEKNKKEDDTSKQAALGEQIERERIAVLSGVEKIEAERAIAIRKAREKYANEDPSKLIEAIDTRFNHEIERFNELEARRKQAEDERAAREKQQSEERERREREALERLARQQQEIADKTAAAIASAFSKARTDFASALSMKDLVIGVQALNANLDNMRRNRQQIAAGDIYSG